jgi:hypothetical protein
MVISSAREAVAHLVLGLNNAYSGSGGIVSGSNNFDGTVCLAWWASGILLAQASAPLLVGGGGPVGCMS